MEPCATSLGADRQVSLPGGADDAWADAEDVTEEDCALRSVPGGYGSGLVLGTGCLTSGGPLHTDSVFITDPGKWIGSLPPVAKSVSLK